MIRDLTIEDVKEAISKKRLISIQTKAGREKRLEVDGNQNFILTVSGCHVYYAPKHIDEAVKDYNAVKL